MTMIVELQDGRRTEARYLRHLRTLTGDGNTDIDEVELPGGERVAVRSPSNDGRVTPVVCGTAADYGR